MVEMGGLCDHRWRWKVQEVGGRVLRCRKCGRIRRPPMGREGK